MFNVQWKIRTFAAAFEASSTGEMVEWSITTVLKTVVLRGTGGSNPSLSAKEKEFSSNAELFLCFPVVWNVSVPLSLHFTIFCFVRFLFAKI